MNAPENAPRQSPIEHVLSACGAEVRIAGGASFAVRLQSEKVPREKMTTLGLCDVSGLNKLGLKGPDTASWLANEGVSVPNAIYDSRPLDDGGLIVRLGGDEFFLEGGLCNESVPAISARLDTQPGGAYRVVRQEATFLLVGARRGDVLAQTCGIDFREAATGKVVLTRVAGVSCSVLPVLVENIPAYRLWVDSSYAIYLWETLAEICESLDGDVIGAECVYPELLEGDV